MILFLYPLFKPLKIAFNFKLSAPLRNKFTEAFTYIYIQFTALDTSIDIDTSYNAVLTCFYNNWKKMKNNSGKLFPHLCWSIFFILSNQHNNFFSNFEKNIYNRIQRYVLFYINLR